MDCKVKDWFFGEYQSQARYAYSLFMRDILINFLWQGGGDKRIVEIKTDFKEKAKPKVGSKDNMNHTPGKY